MATSDEFLCVVEHETTGRTISFDIIKTAVGMIREALEQLNEFHRKFVENTTHERQ